MSLDVSFETCLRRRGHVLMRRRWDLLLRRGNSVPVRRRGNVPLRRLCDVPPRRRWVLHLRRTCDVVRKYRETSLRRCHDASLPGGYVYRNVNVNIPVASSVVPI